MPTKLAAEVSLLAAAAEIDPKPQHVDRQRSLGSAAAHYTRRLELTWLALGGSGWRSRALEEPPCRVKSTGGRDPGTGTSPGKRSGSRGVETPGSSPRGRSRRTPRLSSPRLSSPPPHRTGRPPRLSPYPRRRRTRRSSWPMSSLPPRRRGPRASGCSPGGRRSLKRRVPPPPMREPPAWALWRGGRDRSSARSRSWPHGAPCTCYSKTSSHGSNSISSAREGSLCSMPPTTRRPGRRRRSKGAAVKKYRHFRRENKTCN